MFVEALNINWQIWNKKSAACKIMQSCVLENSTFWGRRFNAQRPHIASNMCGPGWWWQGEGKDQVLRKAISSQGWRWSIRTNHKREAASKYTFFKIMQYIQFMSSIFSVGVSDQLWKCETGTNQYRVFFHRLALLKKALNMPKVDFEKRWQNDYPWRGKRKTSISAHGRTNIQPISFR